MRGLYNTAPIEEWNSNVIVMPWRPRFAPLLPQDWQNSTSNEQYSRCRHYQWVSFPLGGIDLKLREISILTNASESDLNWLPITRYARYDFLWSGRVERPMTSYRHTIWSARFMASWISDGSNLWQNDGCEIRLWPTYPNSDQKTPASATRDPTLGQNAGDWLGQVMWRSTTQSKSTALNYSMTSDAYSQAGLKPAFSVNSTLSAINASIL